MKTVLIVTGLGGSKKWKIKMRKHYESKGYEVDEIEFHQFNPYTNRDYDLYAGHSQGAITIQNSFLPSSKIETWGSPVHFRGKMINDFWEGHL